MIHYSIECAGLSNNEVLDDAAVERLRGCTIITSGGIHVGVVSGFEYVRIIKAMRFDGLKSYVRIIIPG